MLGAGDDALGHRAEVLPAERRPDRFAGRSVPHDRARPLIGDADRRDRLAGCCRRLPRRVEDESRHLAGVELDEAGERCRRWKLPCLEMTDLHGLVHDRRSQTGGADVEDQEGGHRCTIVADGEFTDSNSVTA